MSFYNPFDLFGPQDLDDLRYYDKASSDYRAPKQKTDTAEGTHVRNLGGTPHGGVPKKFWHRMPSFGGRGQSTACSGEINSYVECYYEYLSETVRDAGSAPSNAEVEQRCGGLLNQVRACMEQARESGSGSNRNSRHRFERKVRQASFKNQNR